MPKAARASTTKRPVASVDPVHSAIAKFKRLDRKYLDLARARDAATEAGISGPSESDLDAALSVATAAAWAMAETEPTTVAGAAAMLKHLGWDATNGLFVLDEVVWLETAMHALRRSLSKMARGSCLAA
jgi:hypothetical protein